MESDVYRDDALLEAIDLVKSFGRLRAVDGFSMNIEPGTVKALIGPNGAGKTTFINLVTGVLSPDSGRIRMDRRCLLRLAPYDALEAWGDHIPWWHTLYNASVALAFFIIVLLLPWIPGLRNLPDYLRLYKIFWNRYTIPEMRRQEARKGK